MILWDNEPELYHFTHSFNNNHNETGLASTEYMALCVEHSSTGLLDMHERSILECTVLDMYIPQHINPIPAIFFTISPNPIRVFTCPCYQVQSCIYKHHH